MTMVVKIMSSWSALRRRKDRKDRKQASQLFGDGDGGGRGERWELRGAGEIIQNSLLISGSVMFLASLFLFRIRRR